MIIGGLEKLTLIDFPGKVAAIIFTSGCNFRCQFCYNPLLVWPENQDTDKRGNIEGHPRSMESDKNPNSYSEDDLFEFLRGRVGKLDGVVITGGEPTLHPDLPDFIKKIKDLGYAVKLDSNGTNPAMLKKLIELKLIDYIAMDIKAPLEKYESVVGVKTNLDAVRESIQIIKSNGLPYEFRTTLVPELANSEDVKAMGELIKGAGLPRHSSEGAKAGKWYLQKFKSDVSLVNPEFKNKKSFTDKDMDEMVKIGKEYVEVCEWRG